MTYHYLLTHSLSKYTPTTYLLLVSPVAACCLLMPQLLAQNTSTYYLPTYLGSKYLVVRCIHCQ